MIIRACSTSSVAYFCTTGMLWHNYYTHIYTPYNFISSMDSTKKEANNREIHLFAHKCSPYPHTPRSIFKIFQHLPNGISTQYQLGSTCLHYTFHYYQKKKEIYMQQVTALPFWTTEAPDTSFRTTVKSQTGYLLEPNYSDPV